MTHVSYLQGLTMLTFFVHSIQKLIGNLMTYSFAQMVLKLQNKDQIIIILKGSMIHIYTDK